MLIVIACRDFMTGLARGLSLFVTERHDGDPCFIIPEAALARCLQPPQADAARRSRR